MMCSTGSKYLRTSSGSSFSITPLDARIFSARCLDTTVLPPEVSATPAAAASWRRPHLRQNLALGRFGSPQCAQGASSGVPPSSQKLAPTAFSVWQWEHFIKRVLLDGGK